MEQMYDVLNLLVKACVEAGDILIVGGDFNACIGSRDCDDLTFLQHVGPIGMGQSNARGTMLIHWILQNKFYISTGIGRHIELKVGLVTVLLMEPMCRLTSS